MIADIEQNEQTKNNYNTNYLTEGTNKSQLWYQILNRKNKQNPNIISNIEQKEEKNNYKTKYWAEQQTKTNNNTKYWTEGINKN